MCRTSPVWALQISTTNKVVALFLEDYSDGRNAVVASVGAISTATGLATTTVTRALKELVEINCMTFLGNVIEPVEQMPPPPSFRPVLAREYRLHFDQANTPAEVETNDGQPAESERDGEPLPAE